MPTKGVIEADKQTVNPSFSIADRIFLGEGLFETIKVKNSKPCYALLHWQRLNSSAQLLKIPFDMSFADWENYLIKQIKKDNLDNGGIKAMVSGGVAPRGLVEPGQISQMVLQTFKYKIDTSSIRLVSSSWLRDKNNPIYQVKSVNYLEAIIARRQALSQGADDALFYNFNQHAVETTCANLFLIKNNTLLTPPLEDGALAGIIRSRILSLAALHNISCAELSLTKSMIKKAEAIFITNSLQGIRSVGSLDNSIFVEKHPFLDKLRMLLKKE